MALFCAAIRDPVSLLSFPFFNHVHVFSYDMSLIGLLKRPESCFSSHSYFLVIALLWIIVSFVLLLVAVISLPSRFYMLSSRRCINASMLSSKLVRLLPPSFLGTSRMPCLVHGHPFSCSLFHLFKFFSGPLQEWFQTSFEGHSQGICCLDKVSAILFCLK